ncbi:hypothetical protein M885DRAFT_562417 [Pelagophyceae sp. CCMP2097]|nr:hypothetical protein M885DRAFT_562417 [Pelagophyceae sp. CCMP2097]
MRASLAMAFLGHRVGALRVAVRRGGVRPGSTRRHAEPAATYDHHEVEARWQAYWEEHQTFAAKRTPGAPKKYVLDMFPYPSGSGLHVGHPAGYTASDVMARYWRATGHDVLHPMGWDSFGLPAEQHAIATGTHPRTTTVENIATFKRQLKSLGFSYDWSRELATTDVAYVKWTQWIFLKLFELGLAEQKAAPVNWCPALGTVLSNEEVIGGLSERGNFPVVRAPLRQWVLKITQYADKLLAGLDDVDWPAGTVRSQREWIGKSQGAKVVFRVVGNDVQVPVFTTRPDTLMGATYVVLAPEHDLALDIATPECQAAVAEYQASVRSLSDLDRTSKASKTGVFTGAYVAHPVSGEKLPLWIADYVLATYGTGAVMAVPAHDERDFDFAEVHNLDVKRVVEGGSEELPFCGAGTAVNSGKFDGLDTEACKVAVIADLEQRGLGNAQTSYKLRDWIFSRQRYWGEPIPIYFPIRLEDPAGDPRAGAKHEILYDQPIPVPISELPLQLPEMEDYAPGDDPAGCLARAVDWRYFQQEGEWFARETNTMPQWAGSCWYYLRFADDKNPDALISPEEDANWLPVDLHRPAYVGGAEHAVLHLLYARFWHIVLNELGVTQAKEPFKKLVHQGMILGADGEKMSKSRGNVVNPDDIVQASGADALRLYEMFMGPLEAVKPWQTSQVAGVVRFRDRVFALTQKWQLSQEAVLDDATRKLLHQTMRKVSGDVDNLSFNTAISAMMIFVNHLTALEAGPPRAALEPLMIMLAPFAPHVAEEGWKILGHEQTLAREPWVKWDEALCAELSTTLVIQVNGKLRATVEMDKDAPQEAALALAYADGNVSKQLEGKDVKKIIYVPNKILNIVVSK